MHAGLIWKCRRLAKPLNSIGAKSFAPPSAATPSRPPQDVHWGGVFEAFNEALASDEHGDAEVEDATNLYGFVTNVNTRLNERDDFLFLEACTMFDARAESKTRNNDYLHVLLARFGIVAGSVRAQEIASGMAAWFSAPNLTFDEQKGTVHHFWQLVDARPTMKEFCQFAMEVLKCLPSTALVEARFSLTSMMKSKHRYLTSKS